MKQFALSPPRKATLIAAAFLAAAVLVAPTPARAALYTISDENSTLMCLTQTSGIGGQFDWTVDGTVQMFRQWFWFRIDGHPVYGSKETQISGPGISLLDEAIVVIGGSPTVYLKYGIVGDFQFELWFSLYGGTPGSGTADLAEVIKYTDLSGQNRPVTIFEYVDFDLSGEGSDDRVVITGGNTATQVDLVKLNGEMKLSEVVVGGMPDHLQVGDVDEFVGPTGLLDDLDADTLNDFAGPLDGSATVNPAWAFEWENRIDGDNFMFSKNKRIEIIPEPLTMLGVLVGLGGLAGYVRKRRS